MLIMLSCCFEGFHLVHLVSYAFVRKHISIATRECVYTREETTGNAFFEKSPQESRFSRHRLQEHVPDSQVDCLAGGALGLYPVVLL